jgi:uncharacterized protein (DUF2384 family)
MPEERQFKAFQVGGAPFTVREEQIIEARYSEYKQLTARAVEVFGNELEAGRWLSTESRDFAGRTPLQDFIEEGPSRALAALGRIEHGVFF